MANTATMDFFGHQDAARRKTTQLVVYYILAVAMIIVAVYAAFAVAVIGIDLKANGSEADSLSKIWDPVIFTYVALATILIVAAGTAFKVAQLSQGGSAVAKMLGGRKISSNTTDPAERRFMNVVEEMSIASGTPVASVYVLDNESGINAFAAGFNTSDAIIAATRGCIERLSRDELQGVVAHEFSHILNGDMRLNIKLTGVLHGILLISLIGYWIMRSSGSSRSSRSKKGGGQLVILGILLWIIGYVGVFFGKLIKSAVSRQREFLADASAVQFTRNPDGIAGALKKIGGFSGGSKIGNSNAEEASHFFFANGLSGSFMSLFSTHPPLDQRISRLDPSFSASAPSYTSKRTGTAGNASGMVSGLADSGSGSGVQQNSGIRINTEDIMASVGNPGSEHLAFASKLLAAIPEKISKAVRDPSSARAVIYCMILSNDDTVHDRQMHYLQGHTDSFNFNEIKKLCMEISSLGPEYRIPLADIAVSALKEMSAEQYEAFISNVEWLSSADQEVDLFEYSLKVLVKRRLQPFFGEVEKTTVQYYNIQPLAEDAGRLLSCIAYWGAEHAEDAVKAFRAGAARMGLQQLSIAPVEQCGLDMVDKVMARLKQASPFIRKRIVEGCVECVNVDAKVTVEEAELARAIADGLDCPIPPLMASSAA